MSFDLACYEVAAESGSILEIKDLEGKPALFETDQPDPEKSGQKLKKPITIMLAGMQSPRWTEATDALANKLQDLKEKRSVQEMRQDRAALLAKMTLAWEGIVVDGKKLECTEANAITIYIRFPWLVSQVDRFIGDQKNFLKASSGN